VNYGHQLTSLNTSIEELSRAIFEKRSWINEHRETVDLVVCSPPYKKKDGYSDDLMAALARVLAFVLKPGGRVFFNFGQLREGLDRPYHAAKIASHLLTQGQTIAWVKSLVIDGKQRGHYTPLNTDKVLNYCWEPIFTFHRPPEPSLDRLAVGVPFADKSNMKRGSRGQHGDVHCGGDVWFLPHRTTGAKNKKRHPHEFPEELAERCIKVAGLPEGATVMDPFCGSGTTLCVAKRLGFNAFGVDRDLDTLRGAISRWDAQPVAGDNA